MLRNIPNETNENIIAGIGEDAIGIQWNGQTLVQSVDLITPVVDDPFHFGAIACANALSDLYAKGAVPLFALNIVGFPSTTLPISILEEMIRGAVSKASEANMPIVGGHTIDDTPKMGLAITGNIPPNRLFIKNSTAQVGDIIYLTKPIGVGIYTTAIDKKIATEEQIQDALDVMLKLNKKASEIMSACKVHACTDVTGFGLIGHLSEVAQASQVTIELDLSKVPYLKDSLTLARKGCLSVGTQNNQLSFSKNVHFEEDVSQEEKALLFDPQTSGGLLIFSPPEQDDQLVLEFKHHNDMLIPIGVVHKPLQVNIVTKQKLIRS